MMLAALLLLVPAGDWAYFEPERSLAMLGASADGKSYAFATVGVFEAEDDRGTCKYPALYGQKAGIDELVVDVCAARGACERFAIAAWAADDKGLAPTKCTTPAALGENKKKLDAALAATGIDVTKPAPMLAVRDGGAVTLPAKEMASFGIDDDVTLDFVTDGARAWLTAAAKGCGTQRIQHVPASILIDHAQAALVPNAPFVVVMARNGRDWSFGAIEVPLARLAVRLLTARAESTKSLADVERALALDASYAPAQKLRAQLAKP
jgi:hypothetical protein